MHSATHSSRESSQTVVAAAFCAFASAFAAESAAPASLLQVLRSGTAAVLHSALSSLAPPESSAVRHLVVAFTRFLQVASHALHTRSLGLVRAPTGGHLPLPILGGGARESAWWKYVLAAVVLVVGGLGGLVAWSMSGQVPLPETGPLAQGKAILVKDGFVASFLVPTGSGHAIGIDCGADKDAKALKAALAQYHLVVDAFFLTHGHGDHISGCQAFPQVPLYAMAEEVDLITGKAAAKSIVGMLSGKNTLGLSVAYPLTHAQLVDVSGTQVLAFLVPGHTAGSAAYLVNDVLFLGDSVNQAKGGGLVRGPAFFSDDHERIVASVAAIVGVLPPVELKAFAFAHSAPLTGPFTLLSQVK